MLKAFKYRIYPTEEQKVLLEKHFGCVRWVYNYGLAEKVKAYKANKKLTCNDISNNLTNLKKKEETKWLSEVNSQSLQMSLRNLDNAYQRFFKQKKGFPKFKSKKNEKHSFQCPQRALVDFDKGLLDLPNFREGIRAVFHRQFKGKIGTVTVSRNGLFQYFVSILVEDNKKLKKLRKITKNKTIGIDTGLKNFITLSNGTIFDNPKFLNKSLKRLKKIQKKHSRKKKGSKNSEKSRLKVAKLHNKIKNQRHDYLHKITHKLANDSQVTSYCIEDLKVSNLIKNSKSKNIARHYMDVGLGTFYQFLNYKCEWNGINVIKIGQFDPSSKMCNECGEINNDLTIDQREWKCKCGHCQDRDIGAAINIKTFGLAQKFVGKGYPEIKLEETNVSPGNGRLVIESRSPGINSGE